MELVDADARDLPFATASFDVVVGQPGDLQRREAEEQAQALREAVRVLRPGGRLRIVDEGAGRYAVLRDVGCTDVVECGGWTGGPGTAYRVIT